MPDVNPEPGTARDWLARARGKLALARTALPDNGFLEDLCFCAQQAAELAIKAVYVQHGWMFDYVHNLRKLLDGLEQKALTVPEEVQEADKLSIYAVQTRYPGIYARVTETKYAEAVKVAEAVVTWAGTLIQGHNDGNDFPRPKQSA